MQWALKSSVNPIIFSHRAPSLSNRTFLCKKNCTGKVHTCVTHDDVIVHHDDVIVQSVCFAVVFMMSLSMMSLSMMSLRVGLNPTSLGKERL